MNFVFDSMRNMSVWQWLNWIYVLFAFITFIPVLTVILSGVKLNEGGSSFEESSFTFEAKERLKQHYSRLSGTLAFWKRQAVLNQRFHYYCLVWTIVSSTFMPLLTVIIDSHDIYSKYLLTIMSTHIVLLLAFHKGLKVEERFQSFRHGESELFDTYRRVLDRPETFGPNENSQIKKYFEEVEAIRKFVRNAETNSIPRIEGIQEQLSKSREV